jgi:uncharacterized protein YjbJ (UPF0337 family)
MFAGKQTSVCTPHKLMFRDARRERLRRSFLINAKETKMNWDRIEGNWKQFKGKVKEQWGKLTDDHLDTIGGKRERLSGKIQETYGITKDEADKQIDAWHQNQKETDRIN